MSKYVEHDWVADGCWFAADKRVCFRCNLIEISFERNLPSQSTQVITEYYRDRVSLGRGQEPPCCERDL
jgi:hypothetical protein